MHSKHSQISDYRWTLHPKLKKCDQWPFLMSRRSSQVMKGSDSFSAITFGGDMLERPKHHGCVKHQVDDADRLLCNITFSGQVMALSWGKIFKMTFKVSIIFQSTLLDKRNSMLVKWILRLSWVRSYYLKTFFRKMGYFVFAFWRPNPDSAYQRGGDTAGGCSHRLYWPEDSGCSSRLCCWTLVPGSSAACESMTTYLMREA